MEFKKQFPFATRSLTLLVIAVGIILILVYIGFYNYQGIASLDTEINDLNTKINTHQSYAPMTKPLFERMKVKAQRNLPLPAKAKLSVEQKDQISLIFKDMAQKSKLELLSVSPDINSMVGGSAAMLVHATLKGDYYNFRNFLIELGDRPFLERVEEIEIQQVPGTKEFRLKVWLVVG
jgi:hypothetical protein